VQIPAKYLRGRVIGLALILLAGIYLLYIVREVLAPFVWAAFLAYLLIRPVRYLEERGLSRARAILLVYFTVGGTLILVLALLIPAVLRELDTLADSIPRYIGFYQNWLQKVQYGYQCSILPDAVRQAVNQALVRTEAKAVEAIGDFLEGLIRGYSTLAIMILAPILSFYFLKDVELIKRRFSAVLPAQWRGDVLAVLTEIDEVLIGFIRGNVVVCLIVGSLTAGILSILGVKFALLLGLIAAVAELVPYFGSFIAALPAIGVAMLDSPRLALYTTLSLFVVQQLEGSVIAPKIIGDKVGLHPLIVIFSLFAAGKLWGIVGLLIAVPVAAIIKVILNYIYMKCLED
jgi:predicted PurR-regulated permease PerM